MIVSCPKCGFEQPQIEYCANCGVNMQSYKPKAPPLRERLLKNSYFYILLLVFVVIGTFFFVKENWFPSEEKIYTFVPASLQEIDEQAENWDTTTNEATTTASVSEGREPASDASTKAASERAPNLKVYVAKIPTAAVESWVGLDLNPTDFNQLRAFSVSKPLSIRDLRSIEGLVIVYSADYVVHAFQDPLVVHQTVFDGQVQDDLGFILSAAIDSYKNDNLVFEVNLKRNFYVDEGKDLLTQEQELRLEIDERGSRIITGILPHKRLNTREKELLQSGYLGIMNSPDFQSGLSTFAVIFTYKY